MSAAEKVAKSERSSNRPDRPSDASGTSAMAKRNSGDEANADEKSRTADFTASISSTMEPDVSMANSTSNPIGSAATQTPPGSTTPSTQPSQSLSTPSQPRSPCSG